MTVHFPIALLLCNGLLTWLYLRKQDKTLEVSAYYSLIIGWCGTVAATVSGSLAAFTQVVGPDAPHRDALMWINAHAILGIATIYIYGQALLQRRRNPEVLNSDPARKSYLWKLVIGAIVLTVSGWLGGHMVYNLGVGVS